MKPRRAYQLATPILLGLMIVNLSLAFFIVRRMRKPVEYNIRVIENLPYQPSTNEFPQARAGLLPQETTITTETVNPPERVPVYSLPFGYFEAHGKRYASILGRYLTEGDLHAYGRISMIYPERIYLEGGSYIDNTERMMRNDTISPRLAPDNQ